MITLKTLDAATEQEVFDQVAEHLLKQNAQSKHDLGCAYRGNNGLKCAAGCLIADDEYSEKFENRGWAVLVRNIPNFPKRHSGLIQGLQAIHDTRPPVCWPYYLQKLAREYRLTYRFQMYEDI